MRRPEVLQAALLHDTVEDTHTSIEEIRVGFGEEVAELVDWLTAPDGEADLRDYYDRLQAAAPLDVQLLKLADRVDNLRSIQALVMRTATATGAGPGTTCGAPSGRCCRWPQGRRRSPGWRS